MDEQLVSQIVEARAATLDARRPAALASARAAGTMTARERVDALVDPGSFVEFGQLAGAATESGDDLAADGLVAGAGRVCGQPVVVAAHDPTVRGGTQSDRNQRKLARLMWLANARRWPFVCFVDGDGARPADPLPAPPIVIYPRGRWDAYDGLAELSGWAPTVAIVGGRALDGNAALAQLCDCVIATGAASFGSRDHASGAVVERPAADYGKGGHVDVVVEDDAAAVAAARRYLAYWVDDPDAATAAGDLPAPSPSPAHDALADVIPENRRRPYDMRKVIAGFADADSLLELGAGWARSMLTVLARLDGCAVGILANQPSSPMAGAIDAEAADKAARFVDLCDAYELPIVSFVDNPGYMVGPDAERNGIARHHARPLSALHHRTVPLYSVQLRKAYGLGPYAMSGFGGSRVMPDLRLAWPSVESGGMSLEGAAYLVKRKEIQAAATPEEARAIRDAYAETMRDQASGLRAASSFSFDDVILPSETRSRISALVSAVPRVLPVAKKHPIRLR